jgi:hypothetical protein
MDHKSIVLYLSLKGMTAIEIHADLVVTLKIEVVCYGLVTCYLHSRNFTTFIDPRQIEPPDPILTESDMPILAILERQPFASVRQLVRATHLNPSTVCCHLAEKLDYIVRHLR